MNVYIRKFKTMYGLDYVYMLIDTTPMYEMPAFSNYIKYKEKRVSNAIHYLTDRRLII
jgi:hypothetical protein